MFVGLVWVFSVLPFDVVRQDAWRTCSQLLRVEWSFVRDTDDDWLRQAMGSVLLALA